ncbi:MAG TPA: isoprenylcysteine carboxylmethyltransferase family protein [Terriglobales bacterium]|nr:isoprenylcysteine carboxylmethyltransferase family protein [Terriglobales bacterium]
MGPAIAGRFVHIPILREMENRKLDFLWAAMSFGLAVITWRSALGEAYSPIWLFVALDVQSGIIFAVRQPARCSSRRPLEVLITLISLTYIFAFKPVPISAAPFAVTGDLIAAGGALLTLVSVQCLGRSFAVLPSLRDIRTSGMYRLVRHPIYLSYVITALGILLRHLTFYNSGIALAGVVLLMWRIKFEERLLAQEGTYRDYMDLVRYRLIPGVY